MGEVFTRKFIELDGDPVVGASLRLVSLTWPVAVPCDLYEIVSADPEEQGCYYSSAGLTGTQTELDPGVYRIEIYNGSNWVPFSGVGGSEVTISPGRTLRADGSGSYLRFIVENDQLRVTSLMGDDVGLALSNVQDALAAASTAGLKKVIVGKYRQVAVWQGSGQITIPDGVTLDLGGAEIRSLLNAPVIEFAGAGTVCNGIVSIGGTARAATTVANKLAVFENVAFVRSGQVAPTAASSTNTETPVSFIGCTNVTLAPVTPGAVVRKQVASGCSSVYEVGSAIDVAQVANANATGAEIGSLVRTAVAALGAAPSVTPPFAGTAEAAEALKQMWFSKIPGLESALASIGGSYEQWSWQGSKGPTHPNGDPGSVTISFARATISGTPVAVNCERKAAVYGQGIHQRLRVSVAGTISFTLLNTSGGPTFDCTIGVEMADFFSALQSEFPNTFDLFQNSGLSHNVDFYMVGFVRSVLGSVLKAKTEQVNGASFPYCSTTGPGSRMSITFRDDQTTWGGVVPKNLIYQFGIEMDIPFIQNIAFDERDSSGGFGSIIYLQYDPVT